MTCTTELHRCSITTKDQRQSLLFSSLRDEPDQGPPQKSFQILALRLITAGLIHVSCYIINPRASALENASEDVTFLVNTHWNPNTGPVLLQNELEVSSVAQAVPKA